MQHAQPLPGRQGPRYGGIPECRVVHEPPPQQNTFHPTGSRHELCGYDPLVYTAIQMSVVVEDFLALEVARNGGRLEPRTEADEYKGEEEIDNAQAQELFRQHCHGHEH